VHVGAWVYVERWPGVALGAWRMVLHRVVALRTIQLTGGVGNCACSGPAAAALTSELTRSTCTCVMAQPLRELCLHLPECSRLPLSLQPGGVCLRWGLHLWERQWVQLPRSSILPAGARRHDGDGGGGKGRILR
jgi:hypothetical protein